MDIKFDPARIPEELKSWPQWIVWRHEERAGGKPTKVPYSINGELASVSNPATWCSFEDAVACAQAHGLGIGFVLTEADPFAFIDLDDTQGDAAALDRQLKIFNEFAGYAEKSPSGAGLHIIVKGSIPSGRRRGFIEIYSSARYMTMTGDVYRPGEIEDHSAKLLTLWQQMAVGKSVAGYYAGLEDATETDHDVCERAYRAANGQKFYDLYIGNWQDYYPSQSEADFALINIIAFYTQNRAQIRRIFLTSALGKRDKAQRGDYVNWMLNKSFDRMLPPIDVEGLKIKLNEAIAHKQAGQAEAGGAAAGGQSGQAAGGPDGQTESGPAQEQIAEMAAQVLADDPGESHPARTFTESEYPLPAGLLGDIARYIYAQAPRPAPEIALAGAIGLMCGIVGRAYNVSGTGLNQYVLLLARTGIGKEAIESGIDKLMIRAERTCPAARSFIGPARIASSQALVRYMSSESQSFVSILGEFGIYMQQMTASNANPALIELKRLILDVYNKSGREKIFKPTIHADKEKDKGGVVSPAFSILGESTPEAFFKGLHEGLIAEGLLPRFTVIVCHGDRPSLNKDHISAEPTFELIEKISSLCANALSLNQASSPLNVSLDPQAQALMDAFDRACDKRINGGITEVHRQLWNRAHIKALKLAALAAVGVNPWHPVIDKAAAEWGIQIATRDAMEITKRFESGEVGDDSEESKQVEEIRRAVYAYLTRPWPKLASKAGEKSKPLYDSRVIPYSYVHRSVSMLAAFRGDKLGATAAIKRTLKTMVESGYLAELSRAVAARDYGTGAVCYAVSDPEYFTHEKPG